MDQLYLIIFTRIASTEGFMVGVAIICLLLFVHHTKREAGLFLTCAILMMVSVVMLKNLFSVQRPEERLIEVTGHAFPSGHASGSAFLALSVIFLTSHLPKPARSIIWTVVLIITLLIGYSRLQLGVHTPLQVFAGLMLGTAWLVIFIFSIKFLNNKNNSFEATS